MSGNEESNQINNKSIEKELNKCCACCTKKFNYCETSCDIPHNFNNNDIFKVQNDKNGIYKMQNEEKILLPKQQSIENLAVEQIFTHVELNKCYKRIPLIFSFDRIFTEMTKNVVKMILRKELIIIEVQGEISSVSMYKQDFMCYSYSEFEIKIKAKIFFEANYSLCLEHSKQLQDVIELINIKNKYVLEGKNIQKMSSFTTSQYIAPYCEWVEDCMCRKHKESLNNSLRNLPNEVYQCNPDQVSEEFNPQIISWTRTIYKCTPTLRSSCKMIATTDFLYIFGGSNPNISNTALTDVWRFNLLTRRWKELKVENLPTSLICYAVCWDPNSENNLLVGYLFGGAYDPEGLSMSNNLYQFQIDPEGLISFQLIKINGKDMPSSRCGCSITMTADDKIFLIAGVDDKSYLMDVWVIDVKENILTWVLVEESTELKGRYTHEAILIDGKILLLGGGDMEYCADFKTITAFDINIQQFIQITTLPDENEKFGYPTPRKFHSAVKNNSEIFIIAGYSVGTLNSDTENAIIHDDIWKLSQIIIDNNICYKWSKTATKLKIPLFFHTSAVTPEGCVYTFGGCIDAKSMYPSNKLQRFWVQTPGLKQMAMFKVLFYNTNLVNKFKNNEIQRLQKSQENNETNEREVEQSLLELLYTKPNRLINIIG